MNFKFTGLVLLACLFISFIIISCNPEPDAREEVAQKYCSSCHLFPEPSLLNKTVWVKDVLPAMASKLGIRYFLDSPYEVNAYMKGLGNSNNDNAASEIISLDDWKKIVSFYNEKAPETDLPQNRQPIQKFTEQFEVKRIFSKEKDPITSFIKIDEGNKWIYVANARDSSLNIYNDHLQLLSKNNIHAALVDMQCFQSMKSSGERNGILTNIGIMNPNDLTTGTADSFKINSGGSLTYYKQFLNNMPRPVQTTMVDLDNDGKQDFLVCGFGNTKGELYWMKNTGNNQFQKKLIYAFPGTIKVYVNDFKHDGLPDIMALMAQAQEGIFLFTNKGNGSFQTKTVLQFPPVYGSSYFELDDFNNDGHMDILYTCGDNADYSRKALKNYHGVYIFMNDGKDNYTQQFFFPIHGCYKAIAKDFDKDGDLDIATISFFPDLKNQPQESFLYLENKGNSQFGDRFQFEPFAIKEFNEGKWLTMDAGDMNGDGYDDIVLGNFTPPDKRTNDLQKDSLNLSFLLLQNKGKMH